MEKNKRKPLKMKPFINIIVVVVLVMQFIFFILSAFNQKKPQCMIEALYNYLNFAALLCSLITIFIFIVIYTFNTKFLEKKVFIFFVFFIVLFGAYVHISQLLFYNDFVLTSCMLLLMDSYILYKIFRSLFVKK